MSADNQWKLLAESENLTIGDKILVDSDDGEEVMTLVKVTSRRVTLRDENGNLHVFDTETLEEFSTDDFSSSRYISGGA